MGNKRILSVLAIAVFYSLNVFSQEGSKKLTQKVYLSGTGYDDTLEWEFYCTGGRNSGQWTSIAVPSCWEQQGFGDYNYGHDDFESRNDEIGLYRYKFLAPKEWKDREIKIVFEGVMTDAEVKINGRSAGEVHQGAFYEFKYSIHDLIKIGKENLLEVKVSKVSLNESVNYAERQADFWIFGGIYRPVYLELLPKEHIERMAVDARATGKITADLYINAPRAAQVSASLLDLEGNTIEELSLTELQKNGSTWTLNTSANKIETWNPERPKLYQFAVSLLDKNGNILHTHSERIGFRTVDVLEGDGIYLNGQRIRFKGVNRHSFYPASGRTTSKVLSIAHVQMMKDMNINAVRTSHYPPDKHFLDACDSLGLMVIDEVCTWHRPSLDTEVGRKIVKETVVRDVNHPSVLLWANGNETGWNTELDNDYAIWDIQKREVIHPWNAFRKTNTLHYFKYHGFANDGPAKDKIFFPTEFLHGLYDGGHGAGLEAYWQQMWNMPTSAGGFLWNFADEAVVRTDKGGLLDTDGNHAADGIVGPYGEKEASYYAIKEIWSPIYIEDRYIRPDFNGIFRVENRFHFTNLAACTITAQWVEFPGPDDAKEENILVETKLMLPDLEPGEKGMFQVEKPENWQDANALLLTALDPDGKEIFTWSYPVQTPGELNRDIIDYTGSGALKTSLTEDDITVTDRNITYTFSKHTGQLLEVRKDREIIPLKDGPVILGHKDKIREVRVDQSSTKVVIVILYEKTNRSPEWTKIKDLQSDSIRWTIYPNGLLDLEVVFKSKKFVYDYQGISFSFPESEVAGKKWLGDGPYRVWRNRMKGTQFGLWENEYNNTITGETEYIYPEFKGFFSNIYWLEVKGKNNPGFKVYCHSPHTYLRMLTPPNPAGDQNGRVSVDFPAGDISFLKNIAPIGTKFQEPVSMGPEGNPENYFGNSDDPLYIKLSFGF